MALGASAPGETLEVGYQVVIHAGVAAEAGIERLLSAWADVRA